MRTSGVPFVCSLLFCLTTRSGQAAEPLKPEQIPGVRAAVQVTALDVDVIATTKDGKPVNDLRREELSLSVDGKRVPLDYFARVDAGTIHGPDLANASPELVLESLKDPAGDRFVPRQFLVFFDDEHLLPWERKPILEGLRDFVTRLAPSDSVSVVSYNASARILVPYTNSKEEILGGLNRLEKIAPRGLMWDSEYKTAAAELRRTYGSATRQAAIRSWSEQVKARETGTLEELRRAIAALSGRSGKRILIYVSRGLEVRPGQTLVQTFGPSISQFDYSVYKELNDIIVEANKAGVTIHALDGKGLVAETDASEPSPPPVSRFFLDTNLREALVAFSDETGGVLISQTNAFRPGLDAIYRESATYYSIGVTLANLDPAKKSFKLKVKTTRPGIDIKTRSNYGVRTPEDSARNRTEMALVTPSATGDFDVRFETGTPKKGGGLGRRLIPFSVRIPVREITFAQEGTARKASVAITVAAIEDTGAKSKVSPTRVPISIPADQWGKEGMDFFVYTGELKSGTGNIRFVASVRDTASERMGLGSVMLRVE